MRFIKIITVGIAVSVLILALLTCQHPTDPFDLSQAKVSLILKSSSGEVNDTSVTDTVGNTVSIGLVLYLAQHFDSAHVEVNNGIIREHLFYCEKRSHQVDTVYYPVTFSSSGGRSVVATGYLKDLLNRDARATIHIVDHPQENQKPELTINGRRVVVIGETVVLSVSATDPNLGQTVTINATKLPEGATFSADTFRWATSLDDVGTDTAVFIARDNGSPVLADTEIVLITVSATPVNRPPVWNPETISRSGQPGVPITLTLADKCTDPDNDALTYSIVPGTPAGDTVVDSMWSFTPAARDTGTYAVRIVARDPSDAADTMTIDLTIIADDQTPPEMKRITPSVDSQTVSSSSYPIIVSCRDASGIASVKCAMEADTFKVTRSDDTLYSATVTGLRASVWNTIRFIATDSAPAANKCTLNVHLTYDATIPDIVPPILYFVNPTKDTVIGVDSFTVTAICKDQSGITSLTGLRDATPFTMTKSATVDSVWTGTVKGLPAGAYATIWLIAIDASTAKNKDSVSLRIKYDGDATGPVMTLVSPAKDSVSTNSSSYTVTLQCTDASGIRSVTGVKGSSTFTGVRGSGNNWTIAISGLTANAYTAIVFTATDSSLRANTSTLSLYIKYDPTMDDVDGPMCEQIDELPVQCVYQD